jgi:hypothetical protein
MSLIGLATARSLQSPQRAEHSRPLSCVEKRPGHRGGEALFHKEPVVTPPLMPLAPVHASRA